MKRLLRNLSLVACAALASPAAADGHITDEMLKGAMGARQAQMQLYAFNLGLLGGMAKGDIEYDAAAASGAADNIVALSQLDQSRFWLPGSDSASLEGSRSLPAIWQAGSTAREKGADLGAAAIAMQAAAGTDLDALRAAMGALGGACGACHKAYRAPRN